MFVSFNSSNMHHFYSEEPLKVSKEKQLSLILPTMRFKKNWQS